MFCGSQSMLSTNYSHSTILQGAGSNWQEMTDSWSRGIRTDRVVDPVSGSGYIGLDGEPLLDSGRAGLEEGIGTKLSMAFSLNAKEQISFLSGERHRNAQFGTAVPSMARCTMTPSAMTGYEKDTVIERLQQEIQQLKLSRSHRLGTGSKAAVVSRSGSGTGTYLALNAKTMMQPPPRTASRGSTSSFVPPTPNQHSARLATPSQRRAASDLAER